MTNRSRQLRTKLELAEGDWARALNVDKKTVTRWEDGSTEPVGLAAEVMLGIEQAIEHGANPVQIGALVSLGIGALICYELLARCK